MKKGTFSTWVWLILLAVVAAGCGPSTGLDGPDRDQMVAVQKYDLARLQAEASRQETLEGSLKRGNVDLSQTTVEYFTRAGGQVIGSYPAETEPLAVVDHGPVGELPIEMRKPTIYVMFNHPVVPLAKLGEPITQTNLMTITPAVPGVYRWYGTRVLSFEPSGTLVDQPAYTVTVSADVKSLGGRTLGRPFTFEFHTETVKGVNFYPGNDPDSSLSTYEVPTKAARYLVLEFNQPVDPAHLKAFLSVSVAGRNVGFQVGRPAYPERLATRTPRGLLVTLDKEPPEASPIALSLADGASPQPGFPARKGEEVYTLQTVSPFRIQGLSASAYDLPRGNTPGTVPVYAEFSHSLPAEMAKKAYRVTVAGKVSKPVSVEVFGATLRINLEGLEPGQVVTLQAPSDVADVYGRRLTNASTRVDTTVPAPFPFASFPSGFHHLEAAFPPAFIYEARNLGSLAFGFEKDTRWDFGARFSRNPRVPEVRPVDMETWKPNKVRYTLFDMKPLMTKGFGTGYFRSQWDWKEGTYNNREERQFAIQVTDIGVTTRYAYNRLVVWVNSLSTGKPLAGARVMWNEGSSLSALTDAQGLAVLDLAPHTFPGNFGSQPYSMRISVTQGADRADVPVWNTQQSWTSTSYGHGSPDWIEEPQERSFLFTDRGLYKPGEVLALRGIHWTQTPGKFTPFTGDYRLVLTDPRSGDKLWETSGKATASGGFAHKFTLPGDLEPATYYIGYHVGGQQVGGVDFTVAQFRRLAFQVNSRVADRPFTLGDEASVTVEASYLAGGAMPGSGYSYYWTRKPVAFVPPGPAWKNHVFGPGTWEGERTLSNGQGKLSGQGSVTLKETTSGQNSVGAAYDYVLETTVQDIDRQAVASTAHVLVHPASFYIGAKFASNTASGWWSRFLSTGKSTSVEAVLVDPQGNPWKQGAEVTATVLLGSWKATEQQGVYGRINTRWDYVETEVEKKTFRVEGGKGSWQFQVKDGGDYLLSLEAKDGAGRVTKTVLRFYATGSQWVQRATETPSTIEMILDQEEYYPGDTARILVRSPLPDARYLMTIEREGLFEQKLITLTGGQSLIEVPVKGNYIPVFYVALTSFTKREAAPTDYFEPDLGRPRGLFGIVGIRVSTRPVELDVEVLPGQLAYKPGSEAEVTVKVTQAGQPVASSEVTVLAVDRGVVDLINYHVPDPLEYFYDPYHFPLAVHGDDSRRLLMKPVTYDTTRLTGGAGDKLQERKDFRPLALFEPFVITDAQGVAKVKFQLPDSLTTYRLTAVALQGSRLGIQEGELLVQNPLNVRTALPRRFRNRDTAAAGVILSNLTREPLTVEVTAESDLLTVAGEATKTVEVPAAGVYELPFILSATRPGEGTVAFTVRSTVVNEKVSEPVIVERPLVKEAFTTVGSLSKEASEGQEGLVLPRAISPGYGSLTIRASSSLRPYIEPALTRLLETKHWWSIQSYYSKLTASFAYIAEGEDLGLVQGVLVDLAKRQLPGGGLQTYNGNPPLPDPYVSLLTAHLLGWASDRGWKPAEAPRVDRLLRYLETLKLSDDFDPYFQAYLALVLAEAGRADRGFLTKVEAFEDRLGLGGYGLLAQAWRASGDRESAVRVQRRAKNFVQIGTQTIDLKETYQVTNYWTSEVAEMALLLKNAFELGEDAGFVQRVAGSLNRSERYWQTRNDDLWTLLGFLPLLDAEGPGAGDARFQVTTGTTALADFGLTAAAPQDKAVLEFAEAPLAGLPRDQVLPVAFTKTGETPVYYTTILQYALPNETALARDEGIGVTTRYETLDGKAVGENDLVLGETYRVRVDVETPKRRQRLELLVPIPNGAEIVDPTFATTGRFQNRGGTDSETIERETVYGDTVEVTAEGTVSWDEEGWYWYRYYPDSFALDNLMVYRWTDFYAGTRTLTFLVRITTPGIYPTPGASASLEFEPEVFGRSEGKLFVIKP